MDGQAAERVDSDLISVVERRRAEGLSVAAACRAAGISTSTYYRKRRAGSALAELAAGDVDLLQAPPETVGLMVRNEARSWPFTARAPFYWDQVFADELSDSFVRREFGRGAAPAPSRGALTALADTGAVGKFSQAAARLGAQLSRSRLRNAAAPLAAALFFALVAGASVWMVSAAADPAAWVDPGQSRVAASAAVTSELP